MFRALRRSVLLVAAIVVIAVPATASANHSWGGYHWARESNPFTLKLGDNVSGPWDAILATTSADWSQSTVLNTTIVAGGAKNRNCRATTGRVEVCNGTYGSNGWLGIASISVRGSHITAGSVRLNDTYLGRAPYNTTAWRNLVSCQEVGHTLGLDHQDEDFDNANLGTCMDYTDDPSANQHPNQHDYEQLVSIYNHTDSTTTVGQTTGSASAPHPNAASEWGIEVARSAGGQTSTYVRDLGAGYRVVTHVIWAR